MLAQGFHLAGYIGYEAGFALEPALADLASSTPEGEPLVWLGCYRTPALRLEPLPVSPSLPSAASPVSLSYSLSQHEYQRQVETVRDLIARGETYQLNLTMEAAWVASWAASWATGQAPAALYERWLYAQPVPYAALLHPKPDWHILSLSPELFLQREGERIQTRPMKGTASPGMDIAETNARAQALQGSEKDRAENVMIVDLLRSDLGRICRMGSVQVTRLFEVERYPTVLQMTSTIEGRLRDDVSYKDIFRALFPSGSVVGAPKIHAMRLLHALEKRQRGVYTGAIGYISPRGEAEFNVAIRTVSLKKNNARLGVGSGITYDSTAASEYAECVTKTMFLHREPAPPFEVIETLRLQDGSYTLLEEHLSRMAQSAEYFDFAFDETHVRDTLQEAAQAWGKKGPARVRLLLGKAGTTTCTTCELLSETISPASLLFWGETTSASDPFLRHKTTHRALYDNAFKEAQSWGFADCLFQNTRGEVTEGAIHNVIVLLGGEWITPPLCSGVLPGIYRGQLLQGGRVREKVLPFSDLLRAQAIFLCNSVRGMRRVGRLAKCEGNPGVSETMWTGSQTHAGPDCSP